MKTSRLALALSLGVGGKAFSFDPRTEPELMKILLSYGTHAKAVIPELTRIADYFAKDEKDFPPELMRMKAKCVRETSRLFHPSP